MNEIPHSWLRAHWPAPACVHACSTSRQGGVSRAPRHTLNLALHVGDDPDHVRINRARLMRRLALPREPAWLSQVHGSRVVDASTDCDGVKADASVAFQSGVVCAVLTADCLPVLLCDRAGLRVAAAHVGWRGLLAGVLEVTVEALAARPAELMAWFGPAIGPTAFEVGPEVRNAFVAHHAGSAAAFAPSPAGRWLADICQLARLRLAAMGVTAVFGGGLCTYSDPARFFSYRRDKCTGRMANLIWLAR
ncbi:MAG: peptidoglycan editing factor PgeF [Gammaproteobacteria bacterium]|nr:peptidoglycan editing factor PgeF [Gammaproteobacteria bacterium]